MRPLRIFISSPMDVSSERTIARRVVERLALEYAYHFKIEPVMSELEPMVASQTPQASITPPSTADIVITLLWSRLGTALPEDPRYTIDEVGRRPTGTEWEFFDALRAKQNRGLPELLVYRKTERVTTELDDESLVLENLRQKKELERFLDHWFKAADGSWKAYFHKFEKEDELEYLLDTHLRKLIDIRIEVDPQTDDVAKGKVIEGNPFRGLRSFEIEDAPLFFGRTRALNELRTVLETQNARRSGFVVVTGGSGSGKSSLVKAGLLADLQNPYRIGRVGKVRYAVMRPTDRDGQVIAAIADALLAPTAFPELAPVGWTAEELARVGAEDPQRLIEALRHAAAVAARSAQLRDASDVRLCLVVDQLEELFTSGIPKPVLMAFTRLVTLLARSEIVWIVSTLRSDFYHRLDELPDLLLLSERGYYRLKAPLPTELGQMIRKPAQLAGLRFQKHPDSGIGLDAVLQDDAVSDPTALPLLEFALTELWSQRSPEGLLTFDAYERMGRLTGAIAERAEALIASLTPGSAAQLAPALRALVTVSRADVAPTATTVPRSHVATTIERAEILDKLIDARLVVSDDTENRGDPKCRLAHEKLIETWPRLRKLAEADRAFLEVRARLRAATEMWSARGKKRDLLLAAGTQLAEGEQTLLSRRDELDNETIGFVEASAKAEAENRSRGLRRARKIAAMFASLFLLTLGLAGWAIYKSMEAHEKEKEARNAATRAEKGLQLAMQAASTLGSSAGTSGGNIESVLGQADRFLEDTINAGAGASRPAVLDGGALAGRASTNILIKRAEMLLSFAETSERLGNFDKMRERIMFARGILEPICGGSDKSDEQCLSLLSETYVGEGRHFARTEKAQDAIRTYHIALELLPKTPEPFTAPPMVARARVLAAIASAHSKDKAYPDALKIAEECIGVVKAVGTRAPPASGLGVATADCHLAAGRALHDMPERMSEKALAHAQSAIDAIKPVLDKAPSDVAAVERDSKAHQLAGEVLYQGGRKQLASDRLANAVRRLDFVVRNNPQNEDLALLLDDILRQQRIVYAELGRSDLAGATGEARVAMAAQRTDSPRGAHWQQVRLSSLVDLAETYEARRPKDALDAVAQEIALRRAMLPGGAGRGRHPVELLWAHLRAGNYARNSHDGVRSFEFLREMLDEAENQREAEAREKPEIQVEYNVLNAYIDRAIVNSSYITSSLLPVARRLDILQQLAARIERHSRAEPRIVTWRFALGRALYQLAIAYEEAGSIRAALETHERASAAGWRASTIVLRRWHLEGYRQIKPDLDKARRLEELAAKQGALASWDIEVRHLRSGQISNMTVYLEEAGSDVLPLIDEEYRLKKFENSEITDNGRRLIARIYELASQQKESVDALLKRSRNKENAVTSLPASAISHALQAIDAHIKAQDIDATMRGLMEIKLKVVDSERGGAPQGVTIWATLAEYFATAASAAHGANLAAAADTAGKEAAAAEQEALRQQSVGSSPHLEHAAMLERFARRAASDRPGTAIAFYSRANELRQEVRLHDPKNSECACVIAQNFAAISNIERRLGNLDQAVTAMHKAYLIRDELNKLEPGAGWGAVVANSAKELASLYGDLGVPRLAVSYARKVAQIHNEIAGRHSADSQERQQYAAALEQVGRFAAALGQQLYAKDKSAGEEHFQIAIDNYKQAIEIRSSVLAVDPSNGECRCLIASAHAEIGKIYKSWGKHKEWHQALELRMMTNRRLVAEAPSELQWQYQLAESLYEIAKAEATKSDTEMQKRAVIRLVEANSLLNPLLTTERHAKAARALSHSVNFNLSFYTLFVGDFARAEKAADAAVEFADDDMGKIWPLSNKAHALMLMDRAGEAHAIYRKHAQARLGSHSWAADVMDDIKLLKDAGYSHPLMVEIQAMMEQAIEGTKSK